MIYLSIYKEGPDLGGRLAQLYIGILCTMRINACWRHTKYYGVPESSFNAGNILELVFSLIAVDE